jgi:hypothetical protein
VRWSSTRFVFAVGLAAALALGVLSCGGVGVSGSSAALSFNGSANMSWTPVATNTDGTAANVVGYRVYYGTSNSLSPSTMVQLGNQTTYLVSNLPAGTWYFGVKAYTSNGTESAMSNIVQKSIP